MCIGDSSYLYVPPPPSYFISSLCLSLDEFQEQAQEQRANAHLVTTQYHYPLAPLNYILQFFSILTVLISVFIRIILILQHSGDSADTWPYSLDYVSVAIPPKSWSLGQDGAWFLLQGLNSGFANVSQPGPLGSHHPLRPIGRQFLLQARRREWGSALLDYPGAVYSLARGGTSRFLSQTLLLPFTNPSFPTPQSSCYPHVSSLRTDADPSSPISNS